eukprot:2303372-Pyramimonas_sp.AAC.1
MTNSDSKIKGQIVTVNYDAAGPLLRYVEQATDAVILVEEHKSDGLMLPSLQYKLKCVGYHGIFSAAKRTAADGLSAGVA